jgi:alkylhydroperoxidase family enzyme
LTPSVFPDRADAAAIGALPVVRYPRALARPAEGACLFTGDERLALGYADGVCAQPMAVTDELVEQLVERFGRAGTIELTQVIALEDQRARFNHAPGLTDQGFTFGRGLPGADAVATGH